MKNALKIVVAGLVLLVAGLYGCGQEGPTNAPVVTDDSAPEYVFVANPLGVGGLRYSLADHTCDTMVFDSLSIVRSVWVCEANREFYINTDDDVQIYSIDSLTWIGEIPIPSWMGMSVSPDGQYLSLRGSNVLNIVRRSNFETVYSDTLMRYWQLAGAWSRDSRTYYLGGDFSYNLDSGLQRIGVGVTQVGTYAVAPSPDESRVYSLSNPLDNASFNVYSVPDSAIIFSYRIYSTGYNMVVSQDGSKVYFSMPKGDGTYGVYEDSPYVFEYDVASNAMGRILDIGHLSSASFRDPSDIDQIWLSADGTRMVAFSHPWGGNLLDVDLDRGELLYEMTIPENWWNALLSRH